MGWCSVVGTLFLSVLGVDFLRIIKWVYSFRMFGECLC
jgi:hypothetical protein